MVECGEADKLVLQWNNAITWFTQLILLPKKYFIILFDQMTVVVRLYCVELDAFLVPLLNIYEALSREPPTPRSAQSIYK